jgi:hypothetical protein
MEVSNEIKPKPCQLNETSKCVSETVPTADDCILCILGGLHKASSPIAHAILDGIVVCAPMTGAQLIDRLRDLAVQINMLNNWCKRQYPVKHAKAVEEAKEVEEITRMFESGERKVAA